MSDEEEGEIVSDEEDNTSAQNSSPKDGSRTEEQTADGKKDEKKPFSIGEYAAKFIQENHAMRMNVNDVDRLHDDDRSRKRHHHKKEKRRRRDSSDGSIHRKHKRRHDRKRSNSRSRSRSRSKSPLRKQKKDDRSTCKYYLEGKCQKGDDCPFIHAGDQAKRTDLCRFYVSGHCIKRNCPFMHDDFPCKFFHTGTPCFADKNCRFSHAPLTDAMNEVLKRYLGECKGLNREDLERLSQKAKERDDHRQKVPKPLSHGPEMDRDPKLKMHRGPLLELPPTLRPEPSQFCGGDIDLRVPPPGVEDVDYRLPTQSQPQSPPKPSFYRDTIESPSRSATGHRDPMPPQAGTGREFGGRHNMNEPYGQPVDHNQARPVVERPQDPRERKTVELPEMPKTQRDLLMRLQQRVENSNQDSQASSQDEAGGRTPMADEDADESRMGVGDDSDDDHNLADVVKSVQERQPPPPGSLDLASMISSISSTPAAQPAGGAGNQNKYWEELLSIAGFNPATAPTAQTPASPPQQPAPVLDPRRARDPRNAIPNEAVAPNPNQSLRVPPLPIFPTLEVTTVIESRDGDAPYILRPIQSSPANYENFIHLVKIDFKLKSDPRLIKFLEKAAEKEKMVDTPQSPPPQQPPAMYLPPMNQMGAPPQMGQIPGIRTPLLPLPFMPGMPPPIGDHGPPGIRPQMNQPVQDPRFGVDPRSQTDPRVHMDPRSQQPDPRSQMDPRMANARLRDPRCQPLPPPDPRLSHDVPKSPIESSNNFPQQPFDPRRAGPPPRQIDPRFANRDPRSNGHSIEPPVNQNQALINDRPSNNGRAAAIDPRRADPRQKDAVPEAKVNETRVDMTYSSPLSGYDGAVREEPTSYQRRNIGRIKKKTPAAPVPAEPAMEAPKPSEEALPPPPSLLSHPVDLYGSAAEEKPLSEMFKKKDPTASPFN